MSQTSSFGSTLLAAASSVDTSPQRLQELFKADPSLGVVIATNPSASIQLLDQLASQFPAEVLANPALQLLSLEAERVYGAFSLRSLVCLSLSSELKQETQLLEETKRRMHKALDRLRSQEMVGLSCVWLWRRAFTLRPQDCDSLID